MQRARVTNVNTDEEDDYGGTNFFCILAMYQWLLA